jgi:hypothetical protein
LYFLDEHFNCYTWASPITTRGSAIAVQELIDQIKRVRNLRKCEDLYPLVELSHTHFPNQYTPDRERPHLPINSWVALGADDTGSAPAAPGSAPAAPVTLKVETED